MGLILDSTELIWAERRRVSLFDLLSQHAGADIAVSVITLSELHHGLVRANDALTHRRRTLFIQNLRANVPIVPIDEEVATEAGTIDGRLQRTGRRVALGDLLIAATALVRGDAVVTRNLDHFQRVPNLTVIPSPSLRVT